MQSNIIILKRIESMINNLLIYNIILVLCFMASYFIKFEPQILQGFYILILFFNLIGISYIHHIKSYSKHYIYTLTTGKDYYLDN